MKNPTFKGGFMKNQYRRGRLPKKGRLGQFTDLRGRLGIARKRGVMFLKGIETPMHTIILFPVKHQFSVSVHFL